MLASPEEPIAEEITLLEKLLQLRRRVGRLEEAEHRRSPPEDLIAVFLEELDHTSSGDFERECQCQNPPDRGSCDQIEVIGNTLVAEIPLDISKYLCGERSTESSARQGEDLEPRGNG